MSTLREYAKAVSSTVGAVATFVTIVVAVVDDNNVTTDEWGILATAAVTLIGTVVAVVKTRNSPPSEF